MAVHNGDLLNIGASREEEVQHVKELFSILQVDLPEDITFNRSHLYESKPKLPFPLCNEATMFRNVHEKPKTPTEKKESIMLKEAKARYFQPLKTTNNYNVFPATHTNQQS